MIIFFRRLFSEYTEANATTLIPLDSILPEIGTVSIAVSFTVCTIEQGRLLTEQCVS